MKLGFIVSILVCLSFSFMVIQTKAAFDPETLTGAWMFDEGKGDVAGDASGNGLDGVLNGKAKWDDGKFGKALEFDGAARLLKCLLTKTARTDNNLNLGQK